MMKYSTIKEAVLLLTLLMIMSGCGTTAPWKKEPYKIFNSRGGQVPAPKVAPQASSAGSENNNININRSNEIDLSTVPVIPSISNTSDIPPPIVKIPKTTIRPLAPRVRKIRYTVKRGDSLWKIGRRYGVSKEELAMENNMRISDLLHIGKKLTIPAGGSKRSYKSYRKTTRKTARKTRKSTRRHINRESLPADKKYIVRKGDSLWVIARKFGLSVKKLKSYNNLTSNFLRENQVLVLADSASIEEDDIFDTDVPKADEVQETKEKDPFEIIDTADDEKSKDEDEADVAKEEDDMGELEILKHEVAKNDTLEEIAIMYDTTVSRILKANNIKGNEDLKDKMILKIPVKN